MPDTGHFYVLAVDYGADEDGQIRHVNSITVRCNRCHHINRIEEIERIAGGTVLTCSKCGARQAVSNARLVECDHSLGNAASRRRVE
jgi:hypothetical protein